MAIRKFVYFKEVIFYYKIMTIIDAILKCIIDITQEEHMSVVIADNVKSLKEASVN